MGRRDGGTENEKQLSQKEAIERPGPKQQRNSPSATNYCHAGKHCKQAEKSNSTTWRRYGREDHIILVDPEIRHVGGNDDIVAEFQMLAACFHWASP